MSRIALDSNILIYNHSLDHENKRLIARDFFKENPVVSSQVISEYLNVMKRNFKMQKLELMQLCSLWLEKCSVQPVILSTIKLAQDYKSVSIINYDIITIMHKNIKYLFVLLLPLFSCGYNITTVEMIEQKKGLLEKLKYRIDTTVGSAELGYKTKQIIDLQGQITRVGSSVISFHVYEGFADLHETCYYSSSEKRIVVYFYLYKYEIKTIENINTVLFIEPFENFNGFYTEYFIFKDNLYQAVSLKPEIEIGEYVEEFDFKKIRELKITQYKQISPYGENDKLIEKEENENGIHTFCLNYIFPEEFDPKYVRLSLIGNIINDASLSNYELIDSFIENVLNGVKDDPLDYENDENYETEVLTDNYFDYIIDHFVVRNNSVKIVYRNIRNIDNVFKKSEITISEQLPEFDVSKFILSKTDEVRKILGRPYWNNYVGMHYESSNNEWDILFVHGKENTVKEILISKND